jgi:dihydropyrimidinase
VGENLIVPAGGNLKTVDATGKLVIPGGIDSHTHFELFYMGTRTADDFYTGTRAALAGGTTTILNFIVEDRDMSLLDAYNLNRERAAQRACCDYSFHIAVPRWDEKIERELEVIY